MTIFQSKLRHGILVLLAGLLGVVGITPEAHAQAVPFASCPTEAFQTIQGSSGIYSLYTINVSDGTLTLLGSDPDLQGTSLGSNDGVNAIGFNAADGFIYGWNNSTHSVVRIGQNGVTDNLGAPANPGGVGSNGPFVGDIHNGKLYMQQGSNIRIIDLASNTVETSIPLTPTPVSGFTDWAFSATDGQIYAINNSDGQLYRFNPATGVIQHLPGVALPTNTLYGAQYFDNEGSLYAAGNNGRVYRIRNASNGDEPIVEVLTTTGAVTDKNDGARCPLADPPVASVSVAKVLHAESGVITGRAEPNELLTYRFTLTNSGLLASGSTYSFYEVLPAGTSLISIAGGAIDCPIGSVGARLCTITVTGSIPPNDGTATVDMQVQVASPLPNGQTNILNLVMDDDSDPPPGCTGSNQSCTSPPPCDPTTDPEHCVVVPLPSVELSITKTNNTNSLVQGTSTVYDLTVTNNGPDLADGAIVRDQPDSGLSGCLVATCAASGGASCPAAADWPNIFTAAGVVIPVFPTSAQVVFGVQCTVD